MRKADFFSLIAGIIGGVLFALGMCMCLLPEWNTFKPGVVMGAIGLAVLVAMLLVRRKMSGKPPIRLRKKTVCTIALGISGAIVLGVGMSLCMVWNQMVWGIIVGLIGILMLVCLIPLCKGLR